MLRRLALGLLASAISVAALPAVAQEGSADDLGVMSISLKDVVKPQVGFQGALQGAGTPNQAGIGGFLPLIVGDNSVVFADVQANANFADYNNYSSIINTTVAGTTISTSSRLGYRWLNGDRSWMVGLNAGYDTRPMATGPADTGVSVTDQKHGLSSSRLLSMQKRFLTPGHSMPMPSSQRVQKMLYSTHLSRRQPEHLRTGCGIQPLPRAAGIRWLLLPTR